MSDNLHLPKVIGHRGACGSAPENTLASFEKAKQLGIEWVELDVQLTQDKTVVVLHDHTLERTTNGQGRIDEQVYARIKEYDAGSHFSESFAHVWIPTLEEVMFFLAQQQMHVNIELKLEPDASPKALVQKTLAVSKQFPSVHTLFSSFHHKALKQLRQQASDVAIGVLYETLTNDWHELAQALEAKTIHLQASALTRAIVQDIHDRGYQALAYTVNDRLEADRLFKMGVDSIFSDYPDKVIH